MQFFRLCLLALSYGKKRFPNGRSATPGPNPNPNPNHRTTSTLNIRYEPLTLQPPFHPFQDPAVLLGLESSSHLCQPCTVHDVSRDRSCGREEYCLVAPTAISPVTGMAVAHTADVDLEIQAVTEAPGDITGPPDC